VSLFTRGGFLIGWLGGPTYMLPAEHAYFAWEAVWTHHHWPEPEPLGYHLFCLGLCDRGNEVIRRHGTDWFARLQLSIPKLCAELSTGTPELRDGLRVAADELYAGRAKVAA
jgi:hypothetical protein